MTQSDNTCYLVVDDIAGMLIRIPVACPLHDDAEEEE
jgi:hypothetical protein